MNSLKCPLCKKQIVYKKEVSNSYLRSRFSKHHYCKVLDNMRYFDDEIFILPRNINGRLHHCLSFYIPDNFGNIIRTKTGVKPTPIYEFSFVYGKNKTYIADLMGKEITECKPEELENYLKDHVLFKGN